MDKNQYRLPESEYNDAVNRANLEAVQNTPERLPAGPFKVIKAIENTIFDRRDTAVAIEQTNGRIKTIPHINIQMQLPPRAREVIEKKLIEKERAIGGRIYQGGTDGGFSFWLDQKGSSVVGSEVADWHLEVPNPNDPKNPYGVHIETTEWQLKKFHKDGRAYPMTIQDIERFVPAVYHYAQETLQLYPFEQEFEDVLHDIEIPDTIADLLPARPTDGRKSDYERAA